MSTTMKRTMRKMKINVSVESTGGGVKRAGVKLWSKKNPALKLHLYSYYHEDIVMLEKLLAEKEDD